MPGLFRQKMANGYCSCFALFLQRLAQRQVVIGVALDGEFTHQTQGRDVVLHSCFLTRQSKAGIQSKSAFDQKLFRSRQWTIDVTAINITTAIFLSVVVQQGIRGLPGFSSDIHFIAI